MTDIHATEHIASSFTDHRMVFGSFPPPIEDVETFRVAGPYMKWPYRDGGEVIDPALLKPR